MLVDEYQDTNAIQADIITYLAGDHGNVMVVGDDSQSIYSFRGANYENMFDFPKSFFLTDKLCIADSNSCKDRDLNTECKWKAAIIIYNIKVL